ncbi:MAG: hypothetical protein LBI54_07695 [Lachnospiraceae bacterium]|jgi:hypothetical protein|nr:hypothetical protein [Lachnospiraceae bacterium]
MNKKRDTIYLEILLSPLDECIHYKPAFGGNSRKGVDIEQFRKTYSSDPLYHWVGLDSDLIYAAHKAAGGMTSIYRQLGIGCERLLRKIMQDEYRLNDAQTAWSYEYNKENGSSATLTLDACIRTKDIEYPSKREKFRDWLIATAHGMNYSESNTKSLSGAVFEIRQGYKSADSKRQNADLRFGMRARSDDDLLPVIMIVSAQINSNVFQRYRDQSIHMMLGVLKGDNSTFAFFSDVIGYDLADFFNEIQLLSDKDLKR